MVVRVVGGRGDVFAKDALFLLTAHSRVVVPAAVVTAATKVVTRVEPL